MKPKSTLCILLALTGSSLIAISSAHAQADLTWDITPGTVGVGDGTITGGTGTWNTTNGNWTADGGASNVAWTNGDNAFIIGTANMTIDGAITAGTLSFTSGGVAGRTISGSEITINNGMYLERLSSLNWSAPIKLGGDQTWTHNQINGNSTGKNITGTTNLNGSTLTWDTTNVQSNNRINHQNITGTGSIIKDGTGWLGLGGTNTYTGSTTINAGTIDMTSAGALGNTNNNLTVNTGGTLNIAGNFGLTVGNLTGTGGVITTTSGNTNTRTLTIGSDNATGGNFQGQINDGNAPIALTKIGNGTLTLSGDNSYTGATLISAGTLLINNASGSGTGSGTVTVDSGATLGGGGTIGGATTVNGNLNPGNSPGVLSFSNSLALTTSSTTTFEINGTIRDTEYDGVNVGTTLGLGGDLVFELGTIFTSNAIFNLFDVIGLTSGDFDTVSLAGDMGTGSFTFDTVDTWILVDGDNTWTFTQSTGDLNLTVIPEPGAALLGGLGLLALLRRRR